MMEVMTLITMVVEMVMMMVMVMVRPGSGIAAKVHCDIAIYIYCRFRGRCILRSAMHTALFILHDSVSILHNLTWALHNCSLKH